VSEFAQPQPRRVRRGAPATPSLLFAILAAFGFEVLTGAWKNPDILVQWAIVREYVFQEGEYWRLLTAMFLHGDGTARGTLLHLMLNAFALLQLGTLFEVMFGTKRFVTVYFVSGLLASLTSAYFTNGASVGASGAIFGIVGAFVTSVHFSPRYRQERRARSIIKQLIFWTIANIVIGLQIPKIDMSAHLGGLVAGLILGALLPHPPVPPPPPAQAVIDVRPHDFSRGAE
jgi:rhomboid protease GluP